MKYSLKMLEDVNESLEVCREFIESKQLVKLNSTYSKFSSSFNKFFLTLSTEKIINLDPYGEDNNLKELEVPDQSPVPYNEEEYTISIRLTHYSTLLNYVKDNNLISIENLNPDVFIKLEKLIKFLDWDRIFDPQPIEVNTEAINKILFNFQKEHDPKFIIASLKASTKDLFIYCNEFLEEIKPVKLYINEKYKFFIREEILDKIKLPPELKGENIKKAHDLISVKIKKLEIPIYIELIGEILKEDFCPDGEEIKGKILEELQSMDGGSIERKPKEEIIKKVDPIEPLRNSILELAKSTSQVESIIYKSNENAVMFRDESFSFVDKIFDYIKHNILSQKRSTNFDLKLDNSGKKPQEKSVEIEKFISSLKSLDKKLSGFKNINSEAYIELFDQDEEDIKIFIHQLLSKCRHSYKILAAFDSFFKSNLNNSKGIQIELKVYNSALEKAQDLYFEYGKLKSESSENSTYKPGINLTT